MLTHGREWKVQTSFALAKGAAKPHVTVTEATTALGTLYDKAQIDINSNLCCIAHGNKGKCSDSRSCMQFHSTFFKCKYHFRRYSNLHLVNYYTFAMAFY